MMRGDAVRIGGRGHSCYHGHHDRSRRGCGPHRRGCRGYRGRDHGGNGSGGCRRRHRCPGCWVVSVVSIIIEAGSRP
jgi:hypothetical protein